MATAREMFALTWFLKAYPKLFPNVTTKSGTTQDDWAGRDAWLIRNDEKLISIGIRSHGPDDLYRYFTIRLAHEGRDPSRFEFAKLEAGGGPDGYLQVWEDNAASPCELVFVNMKRMREAGCFDRNRFQEFWKEPYLFKKSNTFWAKMPIEQLIALPTECVRIANVHDRGLLIDDDWDQIFYKGKPRKRFRFTRARFI